MFKNIFNLFKSISTCIFAVILLVASAIPIICLMCSWHIFDTAIYNWLLAIAGSVFPLFICYRIKKLLDELVEDLARYHAGICAKQVGEVLDTCMDIIILLVEKQISADEAKAKLNSLTPNSDQPSASTTPFA